MRIEVDSPDHVNDLVSFLSAMGYVAIPEDDRIVAAFLPLAASRNDERCGASLVLRVWGIRRGRSASIL